MFGSIGGTELLVILVIALLVFGPRKLPQLGRTIGKAMGEFRRASNDFRNTLETEIDTEEATARASAAEPAAPEPGTEDAAATSTPPVDKPPTG